LKGLEVHKTRILTLVVFLVAVTLSGCIVATDSSTKYAMSKEEQAKFSDQVACKVVEKLKKECPLPSEGLRTGSRTE
jgi:hypothetical protein